MRKYPLTSLLKIRLHREHAMQLETLTKKQELNAAEAFALSEKQKALDFQEKRPYQEQALFERIKGKEVSRTIIDRYHTALTDLKLQELNLFELAKQAEQKVNIAEQALILAQENQKKAQLETVKIEEHKKIWNKEENMRLEAVAESELEDFTVKSHDDDENMTENINN